MTRVLLALSFVWSLIVLAAPAGAHPGHGQGGGSYSLVHYLSEPIHVAGILVVLGAVVGCVRLAMLRQHDRRS